MAEKLRLNELAVRSGPLPAPPPHAATPAPRAAATNTPEAARHRAEVDFSYDVLAARLAGAIDNMARV